MKLLVDLPDHRAAALLDVLNSMTHVKVKPLTDEKALLLSELREAVDEMKAIRAGKKKVRPADDFLNAL